MREIWAERVRDTRLPGSWGERLDSRPGWRLRRFLSPVQPIAWVAAGTAPARIGYGPGPLTAARRVRQMRAHRPVRLCLIEGPTPGPRFGPVTAYWVNEHSRLVHAVVDSEPERADLVWVHSQDPLGPSVRAHVDAALARVRPGVPVLNPPETYDAYHHDDTFARLSAAGVRVPDHAPRPGRLAVLKGPGQASEKRLAPYDGRLEPGWRAFAYVDARGPDGLHRRYRAFHWLGAVHAADVVGSRHWEVGLASVQTHEPTFALTGAEEEQIRRIGTTLGLDWFCVDFVRRAGDGEAVFTDVNVYPTPVVAEFVDAALGTRGRWHFLDTAARMGVPEGCGRFWPRFDAAVAARLRLAAPLRATA